MGFGQTKDLDCYVPGKKKMGFDRTKDLKFYEYTKEKAEKSWVSSKPKIWIVMKKEEKDGVCPN